MVDYHSQERSDGNPQLAGTHHMTTEERSVLAWERIADELTILNQSFEQFLDRGGTAPLAATDGDSSSHEIDCRDTGAAPGPAPDG